MTDQPRNVFDSPAFNEEYVTAGSPSLARRFWLNVAGGNMEGTPEGSLGIAMHTGEVNQQTGQYDVDGARRRDLLQQYDGMSSSQGLLENIAAGLGDVAGQALSPSSYLVAPAKWASAATSWAGGALAKAGLKKTGEVVAGQVAGRVAEAMAGNAVAATALDPALQAAQIAAGQRDEYSVTETALAPVAGAVIGGVAHGAGELLGASPDAENLDTTVKPPPPVTPDNAAAPDLAEPVPDKTAALPADVVPDTQKAVDGDVAAGEAAVKAAGMSPETVAKELPPDAVAPPDPEISKAAENAPEPALVVDRERWGDDGDHIADLARATAQSIEDAPNSEMPDLLNSEATGSNGGDLDLRVGQKDKALATRAPMRGEVAASPGQRIKPADIIEPIKSRRSILKDMVQAFDSTVRQGVHGKGTAGALGTFNRKTGVVRTRNLDDASVVGHELGHDLHLRVIGKPLDALVQKHKSELKFLDYDPTKMRPHEGFAEWLRIWATNPAHVQRAAPKFTKDVFDLLDADYPKISAALRTYQKDLTAYTNAPSMVRAAADVVDFQRPKGLAKLVANVKTKGLFQTIGGMFNTFYRAALDDKTFLRIGGRDLLRIAQENHFKETGKAVTFDLKVVDDPYKLKRMMSDIKSVGMMDLTHGVVPYQGTQAGTRSLGEAIATATGQASVLGKWDDVRVNDFAAYLIAKRGQWLYENRFATGVIERPPTAATLGDHIATIADLDARYPTFNVAAPITYEWAQGMLKKRFDAGLLTPEQYADAATEPFYVPFQRDMTNLEGEDLGGAGKGGVPEDLSRSGLKRLKGSDRPIINPIQSLMQQAFNVNMAIRQNDVIRALDRLATRAGPGSAEIAERIPNSVLAATHADPLEALRSAARKQGLSDVDIADLVDNAQAALGEDAIGTLFGSKEIRANGKPIVFFWDGGKRHALQLADGDFGREMYDAIMGMPPMHADILTNILAAPGNLFRLSITTNPAFLVSNFIRDQMSAWILNDGYIPGQALLGMGQEIVGSETAKLYNRAGGISGGAMTAETHSAKIDADINSLSARGWAIKRGTSLNGWLQAAELSETGTRLAVFGNAFKSAKKQGLSDYEALMEGSYTARDYMDFGRRGSNMVATTRIVPFLNAQLQGTDKAIRTLAAPAARHLRGDVLTKQEERELGTAMKGWAKISALTVASMGLAAINSSSEEWQDMPSTLRATAWLVRVPGAGWLAIPKPFELAMLPNIGERAVEYMQTKDPTILDKVRADIFNVLAPPDFMDNPVIKTTSLLTTGVDTFTGQDVVPDHLKGMEPWLQYQAGTSFLARDIGNLTGQSPLYIDQLINGYFASWGRDVSSLYDVATGRRTSQGWDDAIFTRRFIKDARRGNTASSEFWNQISDSTGRLGAIERTYTAYADGTADGDAVGYLAKQTPEAQAFVAIKQDAFKPDDRRMHPLIRAKDEISVISALRREMSDDRQATLATRERIGMSPDQRRMADDVLSKISYGEARNALVVANDPVYAGRPIMDLSGDYDTLAAISPELSDEFSQRMANAKVYKFSAVADAWPEAAARLLQDGTRARLGDIRGRVLSQGFEGDGRRRRTRKDKIDVPGGDEIAAAQR